MTAFSPRWTLAAAGLASAFLAAFAGTPLRAESQGDTWDAVKQLPDWSGTWQPTTPGAAGGTALNDPNMPLTPEWLAKVNIIRAIHKRGGDVEGRAKYCVELGFPGGMAGPTTLHEFIFTPGRILMTDPTGYTRRIYTDGRKHHYGPPSLEGDSIGHWEGQTLVVDTIGLHHGNEFTYGLSGGHDMHAVERFYLLDKNTMEVDTVLEAPEAFTKPYHYFIKYRRRTDTDVVEDDCAQNNRDLDPQGHQIMSLTPPAEGPHIAPSIPKLGRGAWKNQSYPPYPPPASGAPNATSQP